MAHSDFRAYLAEVERRSRRNDPTALLGLYNFSADNFLPVRLPTVWVLKIWHNCGRKGSLWEALGPLVSLVTPMRTVKIAKSLATQCSPACPTGHVPLGLILTPDLSAASMDIWYGTIFRFSHSSKWVESLVTGIMLKLWDLRLEVMKDTWVYVCAREAGISPRL